MNIGIVGVLLEQSAEDLHGRIRVMNANKSGAPSEKQTRIVRRGFEEWMENFGGLGKVSRQIVRHSKKLADNIVVGMSGQLAFERRQGIGIQLGAIAGQAPVAVEAGEIRLPVSRLFEKLGRLR